MPHHHLPTERSASRTFAVVPGGQDTWVHLLDDDGTVLPGIRGLAGANGATGLGDAIGADTIEMEPGSAFPLHVHPGDHILYVVTGAGFVHIGGVDYPINRGDTIFLPAELPHGVHTSPSAGENLVFLAVGHPHRPLDSADRMQRVSNS